MKPGAMFFHLFFILMVSIPQIKTQQYPCQNTYSSPILQPTNTNPYYPSPKVQNPTQIDPAALQETLNQLVFSKFLSNPSIKPILEPNAKLLNQNGETSANGNTPSVVNNYFIVPPEFFNLNDTVVRKNGKNKIKRKKNQETEVPVIKENVLKERRKKGSRKIKPKNLDPIPNEEIILISDTNKPKKRKRIKSNNKKEKVCVKPQTEKLIDISEEVEENPVKKVKKTRIKKPKPIVELESVDNLKLPKHNIQEIVDFAPFRINPEIIETENLKARKKKRKPKITETVDTIDRHLKNIEEPVDDSDRDTGLTENRNIRDSKTNKNRKESRDKTVPPVPDDVMKSFYPYLNQFYGNMPLNYEQFYNTPSYPRDRENKHRRKPNRNEKPKTKTINVRYKPKIVPEPEITENKDKKLDFEVTTEKEIATENVTEITTEIPEETTTVKDDIVTKENYEAWKDEIEDLQPYIVPELRGNTPYNDFYNDYYPIFYDQSLYSTENEDQAIRSDDRYFYTTEVEDLIRDRRKNDRHERYKPKHYEKDAEVIERDGLRNKFKESSINLERNPKILEKLSKIEEKENEENEITFKTPPGLDNPDFKTRNIKDFEEPKALNLKDVQNDKLSVYSSTKTDILPEIKRIRVPSKNTRPKLEDVETYFANSKVVKYGVRQDSFESNESESNSNENEEKENDGHTTYVLAKSLGKVDDYYW